MNKWNTSCFYLKQPKEEYARSERKGMMKWKTDKRIGSLHTVGTGAMINSREIYAPACGLLCTASMPPAIRPECGEKDNFKNVKSYIPKCGEPGHVDLRI